MGLRQAELIIWVDPYVLDRPWNSDEELDEKLSHMHCHTVGYIAKETDEFVVLAQGYALKQNLEDVEEWGHCWVIPKICILSRKPIDVVVDRNHFQKPLSVEYGLGVNAPGS
jgi:hypothetical protein